MRRFFFFVLGCAFIAAPSFALAQSMAQAVTNRQQDLKNQLSELERQIAVQQQLLDTAQGQHRTLQSQIDSFNAEIKKTQLQIQAINVSISQLNGDIGVRNQTLSQLSAQLIAEKESLAQILRQTQVFDSYSVVSVALGSESVSSFFRDLDAFTSIKRSLADSFNQIEQTSTATEAEKEALTARLVEQQQLAQVAKVAKQSVQAQEQQKQHLLTQTKGVEANYQKLIAVTQKTAAQIRTELFSLAGGGGKIPLPTAITLAKQAGAATGIRPAFILGILQQETNLGANVGQCLLTNSPNKGDGKGKNTGRFFSGVMKGSRDVDPFIEITSALGFDPYAMPVSCPPSYGYGGAMGAAQFIPSTWVLYQKRIAKLAGHPNTPANPWDNLDAFTATALYMTDLGAATQTYSAERTAALKYFAGSNWKKSAYAFYGDSVMKFAADFQQEIDILSGY
ncbi:MAG: lytic murein transglycosylase [Patescibacteria group bacterium]|nr:lytic murein transglycosylase [Patescibacteria group bacterium]